MRRLAASCFGLGLLPLAPGTWGSLPPAIIFALIYHFGAPSIIISIVMAALILGGCVICIKYAPAVIAATGKTDPREVVADEFAGQAVTFLAIPFLTGGAVSTRQIWVITALGFILFRLFDIVKPWPIRMLEKLPKGWGVLADDLMAGAYAAMALHIGIRLWTVGYFAFSID